MIGLAKPSVDVVICFFTHWRAKHVLRRTKLDELTAQEEAEERRLKQMKLRGVEKMLKLAAT